MTGNEERNLDERMERLEQSQAAMEKGQSAIAEDVGEIKVALLGSLDGEGGLLGRVREGQQVIERHDREIAAIKAQVEANTEWRTRITWVAIGASIGGGMTGGGFAALIMRVIGG